MGSANIGGVSGVTRQDFLRPRAAKVIWMLSKCMNELHGARASCRLRHKEHCLGLYRVWQESSVMLFGGRMLYHAALAPCCRSVLACNQVFTADSLASKAFFLLCPSLSHHRLAVRSSLRLWAKTSTKSGTSKCTRHCQVWTATDANSGLAAMKRAEQGIQSGIEKVCMDKKKLTQ
jgi:hypothetical protein